MIIQRIVAQAITHAPQDMREWVQDVIGRGHGLLMAGYGLFFPVSKSGN